MRPNLECWASFLFCTNDYIKKVILKTENRCFKIMSFDPSKADTR